MIFFSSVLLMREQSVLNQYIFSSYLYSPTFGSLDDNVLMESFNISVLNLQTLRSVLCLKRAFLDKSPCHSQKGDPSLRGT